VVEVGPGLGVVTSELVKRAKRVMAVELDSDLASALERELGTAGLTVVCTDAREVDVPELTGGVPYKLVANLPYYAASPILRRFLEQSVAVAETHGLMERLTIARINLVELYHLTGNLRKGLDLADKTVAQAREFHHPYGIALGLRYRVLMLTDMGRFADAVENGQEALRIQRELKNPEDELGALVVLVRAHLAHKELDLALGRIEEARELLAKFDSEGFAPLLHAWRAQILAMKGKSDLARLAVLDAKRAKGRSWCYQVVRVQLNLARAHEIIGTLDKAAEFAEEGLRIADSCGYRYYAMRARQLCARIATDEAAGARHARVADALARSLAGNLTREDAALFLARQGITPKSGLQLVKPVES